LHSVNSDEPEVIGGNIILDVQNSLIGGGGSKLKRWTGSEWESIGTLIIYK
jgi:hypothetical protein